MEFVLVPEGDFVMGTPIDEVGRETQERQHAVSLSHAYYLGTYEATQSDWRAVMGDSPSHFAECGDDCPVENINFFEIQKFIARLNELTSETFRLPTEAEWEYACRAGSAAAFRTGDRLTTDEANVNGRTPYAGKPTGIARDKTLPVGSFPPNAWGLYDMHGNVWEWVQDRHCRYPEAPASDPLGVCDSELRVIRGGSWYFGADSARCGLRYTHRPEDRGMSLGFRLAREL